MSRIARIFAVVVLSSVTVAVAGCSDDDPVAPAGAITVALAQSTLSVPAGGSAEIGVTVTRSGGFTGVIPITATAPTGVTVAPLSVAAGATTGTLVISVAETVDPGTLSLTIRASGQGVQEQTATLSLEVLPAATGDFTLALEPTTVSFVAGAGASTVVAINRTEGFTGPVTFTVEGLPAGVSAAFNPSPGVGNSVTLNLTSTAAAAVGTATAEIRGEADGIPARTVDLVIVVTAAAGGGGA